MIKLRKKYKNWTCWWRKNSGNTCIFLIQKKLQQLVKRKLKYNLLHTLFYTTNLFLVIYSTDKQTVIINCKFFEIIVKLKVYESRNIAHLATSGSKRKRLSKEHAHYLYRLGLWRIPYRKTRSPICSFITWFKLHKI